MNKLTVMITMVAALYSHNIQAQGCSDAGICTAPSIRLADTNMLSQSEKNMLSLSLNYGRAQYEINAVAFNIEYTRRFLKKCLISAKAGAAYINGPLATYFAPSDFTATIVYQTWHLLPFVGVKLPFNDANRNLNGVSLPMSYQSTLGTTDVLAGITYIAGRWTASAAWQQPVTQNANNFHPIYYQMGSIDSRYVSTVGFHRKADVVARVSYSVPFANHKWVFMPVLQPIYHVADDTYLDFLGRRRPIVGSQGLTLNTNVSLTNNFTKDQYFRFTVGAPLWSRDVRPEGLTQFAVIGEFGFRF